MNIKKIYVFVTVLALTAALFSFAACGGEEENYNNIECSAASIIWDGQQTITLTSSAPYGEGEAALFKESISVADITLKDALQGKTVSAVKYISETEISVTLSGTTSKVPTGAGVTADIGRIYVSSNALKTKGNGYCVATVAKAELSLSSLSTRTVSGKTVTTATYVLTAGSFTQNAASLIALKESGVCTLEVSAEGTELVLKVSDVKEGVTSIEVAVPAGATTLGVEFTAEIVLTKSK